MFRNFLFSENVSFSMNLNVDVFLVLQKQYIKA